MSNKHLVLISGASATGKTASLMNLRDPEGVFYMNAESGKELPFASKFKCVTITNPLEVPALITKIELSAKYHTIVIDSLDFLMDMFESVFVLADGANTMKEWGNYAQFFKNLMQQQVAASTKNIIFLAHTTSIYNESDMAMEVMVKVKGSLMNHGIESYFNNVISTKKLTVDKLKPYIGPDLVISPQEEALGFKYTYQTNLTKDTVNERIRGPIGLWGTKETYISNDLQIVLDRLHKFYK